MKKGIVRVISSMLTLLLGFASLHVYAADTDARVLYEAKIEEGEHGYVTLNDSKEQISIAQNEKVIVRSYEEEGYELTSLKVFAKAETEIEVKEEEETYVFRMPKEDVSVCAVYAKTKESEEILQPESEIMGKSGITTFAAGQENITYIDAGSNEDLWQSAQVWTSINENQWQMDGGRIETTGNIRVKDNGGAPMAYVECTDGTNISADATVTVRYNRVNMGGIGNINDREVTMKVTFSEIRGAECRDVSANGKCPVVNSLEVFGAEMHKSGICMNKKFWGGYTQHGIHEMKETYTLYYPDTGEVISQKGAMTTMNSLNKGEAVAYLPEGADVDGLKTYVRTDHNLENGAYGTWRGISNDFVDDRSDPSFTKNSVAYELCTDEPSFRMYSDSNDFWHAYTVAPLVATIPSQPTKVGITSGNDVTEFTKVPIGTSLNFEVRQKVQYLSITGSLKYKQFALVDILPPELTYENASVWYVTTEGAKVELSSSQVTITEKDGVVRAELTADYLAGADMPYAMETYALSVNAKVNEKAASNGQGKFENTGYSIVNNKEQQHETVTITPAVPKLTIDKSVSQYEWQVGDTVDYRVAVQQTVDGAIANNVSISDISIPPGLQLLNVSISGVANGKVTKKGNTWTATAPKMSYQEKAVITFQCKATEAVNGKVTVNTAKAKADHVAEITDTAEVFVNTADLSVTKAVSKYEWKMGDNVTYTVKAKNTKAGSVARNVVISDTTLPEGLKVTGIPTITGVTAGETGNVQLDGTGWKAQVSNLPDNQELTISFQCKATEAVNGKETVNTVKAKAKNAKEVQDKAKVYVNTPKLELKKAVSKYEWQVGDSVDYTVTLKNIKQGTFAHNVSIEDISLPEGLKVAGEPSMSGVPSTVTIPIAGDKGTPGQTSKKAVSSSITKSGTGWAAQISELPANQEIKITYRCTATEVVNGKETVNTARAKADNAAEVQDKAEVYINTAALTIDKSVSQYEWRVGETVDYTVTLKNTRKGTIARNVVVQDATLPEGLELKENPVMTGGPESIKNPITGNKMTAGETEDKKVISSLKKSKGGWTATLSDLPADREITITFRCIATQKVNGMEIINTAKAKADNAKSVQDTAKIWVNSPGLTIDKQADIKKVKAGDLVTYTLTLQNQTVGTLARNIVITDALDEASATYMKLQKNSISVTDTEGNKLEDVKITVQNNAFKIETKRMLVNPEKNYDIWDIATDAGLKDGGKLNPEGVTNEALLTVEYQAKVTSEEAAGETLHNVAMASCDEDVQVKDEEDVVVNGPHLDVEKTSDKQAYTTAEIAKYKVIVRQTREGYQAKQVVMTDAITQEGAVIVPESVTAKLNGKTFKPLSLSMTEGNTGYMVETGVDLADDDKLLITYDVRFAEFDTDTVDKTFDNTIIAKGSNTNPGQAENQVIVTEKDAVLAVVKKSNQKQYLVGETGTYTLQIFEQLEDALAKQVTIKDTFDKEGMTIVEGSVVVKVNGEEIKPKSIQINDKKNGYVIETGANLSFKDKMVVTYTVEFNRAIEGAETTNTATVKAENTNEDIAHYTVPVTEIIPALSIEKTSDKHTYYVGETGTYEITVKQTESQGVAKQVVLVDTFDREGMNIADKSIVVRLNGAEVSPLSVQLNDKRNGYQIETGLDLTKQDVLTVSYEVTFVDVVKGEQAINTAVTKAENVPEQETEHQVKVKEVFPDLLVKKSADKQSYLVGETGTYQIVVTQTEKDALARQVVVKDSFDKKGMTIQTDSFILKVNGKEVKPKSVSLNDRKNGYSMETGVNLQFEEEMTVTYLVTFDTPVEEGLTMNTVAVKSHNAEEKKDTYTVNVGEVIPELQIEKRADRQEASKEELITYTLHIREKTKGTAKNVVIQDDIKFQGARLLGETIKILDTTNRDITKECMIITKDHGFTIRTKRDLTQNEVFTVTYEIKVEQATPGDTIRNVATAQSDNTPQIQAEHSIQVPTVAEAMAEAVQTGLKKHTVLYVGGALLLFIGVGVLINRSRRKDDDGKI